MPVAEKRKDAEREGMREVSERKGESSSSTFNERFREDGEERRGRERT